jgi:hypothetical protein
MSEEEYVVEKIVGKRISDDQIEYRVKWEGYSEEENTWEPYESLKHLTDMIEEYERQEELTKAKTMEKYRINKPDKQEKAASANGNNY